MRKVVVFALAVVLFAACDPVDGNLVGVKGRTNWYPDVLGPGKVPYGMVYIPSGAFQAGQKRQRHHGLVHHAQPYGVHSGVLHGRFGNLE